MASTEAGSVSVTIEKEDNKPLDSPMRDIEEDQKAADLCIPRVPMTRLIKEIMDDLRPELDFKMQGDTIEVLREATEYYLLGLFEEAYLAAVHAKRVTIQLRDMELALKLRGDPRYPRI